ncbi:MAG: ComF family protein [Deltaproteobacteria bacterium]|nr:ComF family protein [Deltaproteobacteria bacterium]MBW1930722.1 ComF family protein [Deltaproteobacteria bacterium]MBW2024515.1 ComF family protein [Deltaproteobacteria bacterium]MBW2125765.1 ComF family protein [Deltaproteobacteria bacterium]RLB21630.1 MAG: ComF family protein [Deltaproteobacteria bacterium]
MRILSSLIDLIYPPRCLLCEEFLWNDPVIIQGERLHICRSCLSTFKRIDSPLCPSCGRPFPADTGPDHLCEDCLREPPAYDALAAPFLFEAPLMDAIHSLKYGGKAHFARTLGPLLAEFAFNWLDGSDVSIVMPVPLHRRRLRQRGFNQSLLLARYVANALNCELDFLSLVRVKSTPPQTGLGRKERLKNLRHAFELRKPKKVSDQLVVLIDDVATTGTTFNECAKVLKKAGAVEVLAVALARAVLS